MNGFLKIAGIAIGVIGVAAIANAGTQQRNAERVRAAETFHVTEAEQPIMAACEQALSSHNIEFRSKVSEISGCGCIARKVQDAIHTGETPFAAAALPTLIVTAVRGDKDGNAWDDITVQAVKAHITEARAGAALVAMADAVHACASPDTYLTAQEKTQIAADKVSRHEKSLAAIEHGVKSGSFSRERGEELKARLQ